MHAWLGKGHFWTSHCSIPYMTYTGPIVAGHPYSCCAVCSRRNVWCQCLYPLARFQRPASCSHIELGPVSNLQLNSYKQTQYMQQVSFISQAPLYRKVINDFAFPFFFTMKTTIIVQWQGVYNITSHPKGGTWTHRPKEAFLLVLTGTHHSLHNLLHVGKTTYTLDITVYTRWLIAVDS